MGSRRCGGSPSSCLLTCDDGLATAGEDIVDCVNQPLQPSPLFDVAALVPDNVGFDGPAVRFAVGFDAVDLVATGDGRTWRRFGGAEEGQLPMPGRIASGVRPADLEHLAVMVDGDDAEERAALDDHGLSALVTSAVAVKDESRAVLRAAIRHGRTITAGEIDAFQLLAGQAAVALQNHELLSEITSMHVELEHQAHHDSLTGLPNRAMFLEQLDDAVRDDVRPAVMFLDLDGFKPVNDRLGHDAGDLLLQLVAKRLERAAPAIPPWLGSAATSSRSSSEEPSATSGPERSRPRSSR